MSLYIRANTSFTMHQANLATATDTAAVGNQQRTRVGTKPCGNEANSSILQRPET